MIEVEDRVLGFGTQGVFPDVGLKVMLGENIEADTVEGQGPH